MISRRTLLALIGALPFVPREAAAFQPMDSAPKDGRPILIKVREPAGTDYAIATGNPEGWEHVAEGRWDGERWEYYVQGEPVEWKYEEPGDEVFVRLDGSHPGFEPEETTAPNEAQSKLG